MFGLLRARRSRRAAVALIGPFVEASRRRLPALTDEVWLDPYTVGFIGMLILLAGDRATGGLSSENAGIVQIEAWQQITGCRSDLIGEEICLLSSGNDRMFAFGCHNAYRFMSALTQTGRGGHPDHPPPGYRTHGIEYDVETATALWLECFDAHVCAPTAPPEPT